MAATSDASPQRQPLRIGLLSTSKINQQLLAAVRSITAAPPPVVVSSVASRSDSAASEYAAANGIPSWHGSYDALLQDPDVDAVYVALPNSLHLEWVLKACAAKKHVLCEKPMAVTAADAATMLAAADEAGVALLEGFMHLFTQQTARIRELIADDAIGQIHSVRSTFGYHQVRGGFRRDAATGGSLFDVGVYPVSLGHWLLAGAGLTPCGVTATAIRESIATDASGDDSQAKAGGAVGCDMTCTGTVTYRNTTSARNDDIDAKKDTGAATPSLQFECSFVGPPRVSLEIIGAGGRITASNPFKPDPAQGGPITVTTLTSASVPGAVFETVEEKVADPSSTHLYQGEVLFFAEAVRAFEMKKKNGSGDGCDGDCAVLRRLAAQTELTMQVARTVDAVFASANNSGAQVHL